MNKHNLTVGQELYFVYSDRRRGDPKTLTVTKIGRRWAETATTGKYIHESHRIDIETLRADACGFTSPGQAHLDEGTYLAETKRRKAWDRLVTYLRNTYGGPPANLTTEQINEISAAIGVPTGAKP